MTVGNHCATVLLLQHSAAKVSCNFTVSHVLQLPIKI